MTPIFHVDYETFSTSELSDVGAYRYAEDASTEILMLAIAQGDSEPYLWLPPRWRDVFPDLHDIEAEGLLSELRDTPDALVFAHNAQFERAITMYADTPLSFFMRERPKQWRCTAAMARRAAVPDSLEKCGEYLDVEAKKDSRGKTLIRKFSMLQTAGKRKGERILPTDEPQAFREFAAYCLQDVRTEQAIHKALKPFELVGPALQGFLLDIHLNDRGVPVDVTALRNADKIIESLLAEKYARFRDLCGLEATQRDKVKEWLSERGCPVENMQAETLEEKLKEPSLAPEAAEVMRLYADLSFAAVKKVSSMLSCANRDGRVRGTLVYNGTGPGRSSARLIQSQNFKKAEINPKNWPKGKPAPTEQCYDMLKNGCSAEDIDLIVGEPLEAIASSIRHFIPATLDADYAGLQARVINWLAGQQDALDRFAQGIDAYKVLAAVIFNTKAESIENPSKERDLGKVGELGCGFQMGPSKFLTTCHIQYGLTWVTAQMAKRTVDAYRSTHAEVVKFWYACDTAARRAIAQPNRRFSAGKFVTFETRLHAGKLFLLARLPSGREIAYADPRIENWVNPKTGKVKEDSITYYGKPTVASGATGSVWMRIPTYAGKLAENVTMGVEADLINYGVTLALDKGYDPFLLVHDQCLAQIKPNQTAAEFGQLLATLPPWAAGLPLKAEAKVCKFYAK